jgi:DNA-binding transcriptional LysR family regulator
MDRPLPAPDWSLMQAFLAVADTGSLSGAARRLGTSQPTLGRQIRALEASLDADLFHRQPRGLTLTPTGVALLPHAQAMFEAMGQVALTAAGQSARLAGTVRITASVAMSYFHLPAIIAGIREVEPEIAIDLVPADTASNLLYREADIALRMFRPTQLDLVTRHLGDVTLSTFAAHSYIARRGRPTAGTAMAHDFVGYDTDTAIIDGMLQAGYPVDRDFFRTRCDDNLAHWALVRAGCGIGFAQTFVGREDPLVQEIDFGFPLPSLPLWLTAHEAMRQTPRIRRVWDLLADGLAHVLSPGTVAPRSPA